MSKTSIEKLENQNTATADQDPQVSSSSSSSRSSSFSNSISFIKLNEIESYEPPIVNNQPVLLKDNQEKLSNLETTSKMMNSMPAEIAPKNSDQNQLLADRQQQSLPNMMDKENQKAAENKSPEKESVANISGAEDFQIVDMVAEEEKEESKDKPAAALASITNQNLGNQLGDSLIDMIINLKNENQNLIKALETNNEFVKERIEEFKRATEDSKKREVQYETDKSEHEQHIRKLQRQNLVLSERLKSMETKLKDLKSEANDGSMVAGSSSKASSVIHDEVGSNLYPELDSGENFSINRATTMQVDATSCELNVQNNNPENETQQKADGNDLNTRFNFEATNGENFAEILLKQCSELEKQLNNIEKRDLEICLLQQKLNIFKKDLGAKKMNNFEAKGQIELLKIEIEGLCNERKRQSQLVNNCDETGPSNANFYDTTTAQQAIDAASKLGYHLSKKATRSAVRAAKYASKQAYREQKAAAVAAAAAAAAAAVGSGIYNRASNGASSSSSSSSAAYFQRNQQTPAATAAHVEPQFSQQEHHHHHARHHSGSSNHPHLSSLRKLKTEVVNDLMSTANKAMLTGYKVASTHVNLALDKLSQFEQSQAQNLAKNQKPNAGAQNLHDYYNFDKSSLD